jgi:hypothetical protein
LAVEAKQRRQAETHAAIAIPMLPTERFLEWMTTAYQPVLLSNPVVLAADALTERIRESLLTLNWSLSVVNNGVRRFGDGSLLGQQSSSWLSAYQAFADAEVPEQLPNEEDESPRQAYPPSSQPRIFWKLRRPH